MTKSLGNITVSLVLVQCIHSLDIFRVHDAVETSASAQSQNVKHVQDTHVLLHPIDADRFRSD